MKLMNRKYIDTIIYLIEMITNRSTEFLGIIDDEKNEYIRQIEENETAIKTQKVVVKKLKSKEDKDSLYIKKIERYINLSSFLILFFFPISLGFLLNFLEIKDDFALLLFVSLLIAFSFFAIIQFLGNKKTELYKNNYKLKYNKESNKLLSIKNNNDEYKKLLINIEERKNKLLNDISKSEIQLNFCSQVRNISESYDKDGNDIIDVLESNQIKKILTHHQKKIREIEKVEGVNYTKDLSRVISYLSNFSNQLNHSYQSIGELIRVKNLYQLNDDLNKETRNVLNNAKISNYNNLEAIKNGFVISKGYANVDLFKMNDGNQSNVFEANNPYIIITDKVIMMDSLSKDLLVSAIRAAIKEKRALIIFAEEIDDLAVQTCISTAHNDSNIKLCLVELGSNRNSLLLKEKISLLCNTITCNHTIDFKFGRSQDFSEQIYDYLGSINSIRIDDNNTQFIPDLVDANLIELSQKLDIIDQQYLNKEEVSIPQIDFFNLNKTKLDEQLNHFIISIERYEILLSTLVLMVSRLINDDLISYYSLRDKFEVLGIFESSYERKLLSSFENLGEIVNNLRSEVLDSKDEILMELSILSSDLTDITLFGR